MKRALTTILGTAEKIVLGHRCNAFSTAASVAAASAPPQCARAYAELSEDQLDYKSVGVSSTIDTCIYKLSVHYTFSACSQSAPFLLVLVCHIHIYTFRIRLLIYYTAEEFARNEMLPYAGMWDSEKICPVDTLRSAAKLGFGGLYCSGDYGGTGYTLWIAVDML